MAQAIRFHRHGGPEVLELEEIAVGEPGPGQVRLRQTAIGVNYIDTYYRSGLYPIELPGTPGDEAVGIVEAIGSGVEGLAVGQRVAYPSITKGAYATERVVDADRLVPVPDDLPDTLVASCLLRGLTVEYLLRRLHRVEPGEWLLIHAAAGGVGQIAVQWARHLGAHVIGTAGSEERCERVRSLGADHVIDYTREDFVAETRRITDGRGVDVVYDSVGHATFEGSLDCLRRRGLMVSFGNASGKPEPIDVMTLARHGSLYLTRPTLYDYTCEPAELRAAAEAFFQVLRDGIVKVQVGTVYPLARAADAHRELEDRGHTAPPVLVTGAQVA